MTDHSRAELEDELAIQQVILSSLDGETFEGVESERTEARQEIARLQRLLQETQENDDFGNRPQIETGGKFKLQVAFSLLQPHLGERETPPRTQAMQEGFRRAASPAAGLST
jgi:hypothetical protein